MTFLYKIQAKISQSIIKKVRDHLRKGNAKSGAVLASQLIQQFPKYRYQGKAFRVIISEKDIPSLKINKGESFTLTREAVDQFLEDNYFDDSRENAVVIEAEVEGFNLAEFIRYEMPSDDELDSYLAEQEIIVLRAKKIKEYQV